MRPVSELPIPPDELNAWIVALLALFLISLIASIHFKWYVEWWYKELRKRK